jgi:hypothetical protein
VADAGGAALVPFVLLQPLSAAATAVNPINKKEARKVFTMVTGFLS